MGFNLYHSIRAAGRVTSLRPLRWLDLQALCAALISSGLGLVARLEGVYHPGEPPRVFVHLLHNGDRLNWLTPGVLAAPWWWVIWSGVSFGLQLFLTLCQLALCCTA